MAGDPPSPTEPSSRALDIGSEQTLDGRVLGLMARPTRAPSDDETLIGPGLPGPLHGRPTPAASEALPELDRSGLSPREQALVVSRYVLLSRLGAGGMGLVYLAHDPALERKVAVKLLRPGGEEREQVAEAHARLHREAQALAKLSHPNVVAVHDVGTYDASPLYGEGPRPGEPPQGVFVVMDYIEGVTLEDWLATPRPWRELLRVFIAAGRGLIAAHAVGVIHRDFKPSNVLLRSDGTVQVFDFGLARAASETGVPDDLARPRTLQETWMTSLSQPLTQYGAYVGTPAYTAPEQRGGEQVDERSDQFSFCVALYEGLFGNRPYSGENIYALELAKVNGRIDPPRRRVRLPRRLLRAVLRGLEADPEGRWPTMPALLAELERHLPRHRGLILAACGLVGLLGGALGFELATRGPVCTGATAAFAGAWGEAPRVALERSFAATGLAYAEDTAARVGARLGEYQQRWLAAHTDACEATHVRRSQSPELMDRRLRCLDQRRDQLEALLAVYAAADAEVVQHAVAAAAALPAPESCGDPRARGRDEDLSADPERLATLGEQRRRLAAADAQSSAGHYATARTIAEAALAAAEALGDRALRAEAGHSLGHAQGRLTAFTDAESTLAAAYFDALAIERDDLAIELGIRLAIMVGDQLARPAEGRLWARHVDALLDRSGRAPAHEIHYLDAIGSIAARSGEYPVAEAILRDALARAESLEPRDDLAIAHALGTLASVLGVNGKTVEAVALERRVLAVREAALGPLHPDLGVTLTNLGVGHMLLGEYAEAEQAQRRALELWRVSMPAGHERVAFPLSALGDLALERGRLDEARANFQEALTIWERSVGADHPSALFMHERLATTLLIQGERAAALQHSERALAGWERLAQPDPGGLTLALLTRAQIAIASADFEAAREPIARAHRTAEAAFGPEHLYTLAAGTMQQGLRLETGAPAEALAGLAPILAALERQHGRESRWLVETLLMLGRARHGVALADAAAYAGQRARDRPAPPDAAADDPARLAVQRGFAAARADLERADALARKHELTALQAEVELARARVLWDGDLPTIATTPGADRRQALALALAAAATLRRLGAREALRQAEDWLRAHPAP
jgi:hypothetical protein